MCVRRGTFIGSHDFKKASRLAIKEVKKAAEVKSVEKASVRWTLPHNASRTCWSWWGRRETSLRVARSQSRVLMVLMARLSNCSTSPTLEIGTAGSTLFRRYEDSSVDGLGA